VVIHDRRPWRAEWTWEAHEAHAPLRWPWWALRFLVSSEMARTVPARYARGEAESGRNAAWYYRRPLQYLGRAWGWWCARRWMLERAAVSAGFLDCAEAAYFADGRWTLRFWRTWEARIDLARTRAYDRGYKDGYTHGHRVRFTETLEVMRAEVRSLRAELHG
jgi:hypothetical protein